MTTFDAKLAAKAQRHAEAFGEAISYTPSGGSAKLITAIVERQPKRAADGGERPYGGTFIELWVINDATAGVSTVKTNGDTVSVREKLNDAAGVTFRIVKIIDQDGGFWHLEAQK